MINWKKHALYSSMGAAGGHEEGAQASFGKSPASRGVRGARRAHKHTFTCAHRQKHTYRWLSQAVGGTFGRVWLGAIFQAGCPLEMGAPANPAGGARFFCQDDCNPAWDAARMYGCWSVVSQRMKVKADKQPAIKWHDMHAQLRRRR